MAARGALVCFGEALIDLIAGPAQAGQPRVFAEHPGGAPANVAVGIARLGGHARFVGMLSDDMFGDVLLEHLQRYGVDTAQVRRTDRARTALAFVSLAADGERSFNFYRPPAADLLFRDADFAADAFDDATAFHVCSNSLTEAGIAEATVHGMRRAAAAGALVSMDLNLRPALWPRGLDPAPTLWRALEHAQLLKLSREELEFLCGDHGEADTIARLFAHGLHALVVTDGAAPIRWWTRGAAGSAPTFDVRPVDTTAAGDAFVAGLLWRIAERSLTAQDIGAAFEDDALRADLLRHAAAAGALATTRSGAFAAMPDANDLARLMRHAA